MSELTSSGANRIALERQLAALIEQPLISILLPVYNPDLELLKQAIESVRRQVYGRWELCLTDDASTDPGVRPLLESSAAADHRLKVAFRDQNGHISACSNSALALATGEFCGLLDQDDVLDERALALVALESGAHPEAGLIYSDEDKINTEDVCSEPYYKTDWNPALFLAQNFINHFSVYRTALLRAIGGFREGYEGSQDYDLALRVLEQLRADQVRHIPRVLYHWRTVPGSLASVVDAKPYARDAARRALRDHLARVGISGAVVACPENTELHRVIYDLPEEPPLVSIIIPTRNRADLLRRCVSSVREKTAYEPLEIIIVDNGSAEQDAREYLHELESSDDVRVLQDDGPFNFSRLNNQAVAVARGSVLAFLNNDIEPQNSDWLREMVSQALQPATGAVGARLWYPDGNLQHAGVIVGLGGVAGHAFYRAPRDDGGYFSRAWLQTNYSAVTGACMVVRRELFDAAGGFDETNLPVSFNDVDFCLKLRALGYNAVWTPTANLIHYESASRGHNASASERVQFLREATFMQQKWGAELLHDPFYNPNLSLTLPGFEVAVPPRDSFHLRITGAALRSNDSV